MYEPVAVDVKDSLLPVMLKSDKLTRPSTPVDGLTELKVTVTAGLVTPIQTKSVDPGTRVSSQLFGSDQRLVLAPPLQLLVQLPLTVTLTAFEVLPLKLV